MIAQMVDCKSAPLATLLPELSLPAAVAQVGISGVALDSRQIAANDLFVALQGGRVDGQQFIGDAVRKGAAAVLVESTQQFTAGSVRYENTVPVIAVADLASRVSAIAGTCYGNPSATMDVIGVTGTNGKSTTVSLLAQLYQQTLGRAATIGTLGVAVEGVIDLDFGMTTPDAALCQKLLARLRAAGIGLVGMEVSSHGLDQNRVAGVSFSAGIFTNLSHDHLDYHGTLKNYAAAKQKLFETLGLRAAVINLDDPFAPQMVAAARRHTNVLTYSTLHFAADVYASDLQYSTAGVEFQLTTPWGSAVVLSPLFGEFNVYNLLAALTALCANGCDFSQILNCISALQPVTGRMQRIGLSGDVIAVVDYAHTPDALAQAIAATRVHTSGNLWVVFGCGGDRDRSKRPIMAANAERFADRVVVTSDNPRMESADAILQEICTGFRGQDYLCIKDRAEAIHYAVRTAAPGDVILIAGKGHENYQIIGETKLPFSDIEQAQSAIAQRYTQGGVTE